jgi:hypothetical protein
MTVFEIENDDEDMEGMPISPLPVEDEAALSHAISLILKSGGWGQIVLIFKNGKMEDLDTTLKRRLSLKRRP